MDKKNKVLKGLLDWLISFVSKDRVAKLAKVDAKREVYHKEGVFPIERKSPSFEAQDPLEEVN